MNAQQSFGSQVSAPAPIGSQVSKPALTNPQVSTPAPTGSQVSTPARQPIKHPKDHCRNYLPHIENKQYQMITFRLNDSVPRHVVEQWKATLNHLTGSQVSVPAATGSQVSELAPTKSPYKTHQQEIHRLLKLIDQYEDAGIGECLLRDDSIAQIVQDTLLFNHQKKYELICWCIMPNHVHTLIAPVEGMSLSEIMYDWKSYTTHAINKALNRKGKLWMMEYFDRYIRDDNHFQKVLNYIHNNPVKAGLVAEPVDWRWSSAGSGSQVSVPAQTVLQVSVPAQTVLQDTAPATTTAPTPTGSRVSTPALTITGSQVSKPAITEAVSSSAGSETCRPIDSNPLSAGRETCEPTANEKQQSL
jgi:REP element-mobilizing transposase RayT